MARWWALWLAWGGALSAQASEAIAYDLDPALTCPSPTQLRSALEAQVGAATSPGDRDWLGRRVLRVEPGPLHTLVVELLDPTSRASFRRSIPTGSCQAQALAVALLLRSWLDKGNNAPEAETTRAVVIAEPGSTSPEPATPPATPSAGRGLSLEPRLGGGALLPSAPRLLGGSVEGSLQLYLNRRWGLALRGAWFTPLRASDPQSAGALELRRYALGLDASWTGRPLPSAMDVALGLQDEIDQSVPSGYAQENRGVTNTPQLRVAVRYRLILVSHLFAYAEGSSTVGPWPHRFLAADPRGEVQLLTLPVVQVALDLGLGWHFL